MKKRIQILTLTVVFTLSLCVCSNVFAVNKTSGSTISSGSTTSGNITNPGKGSSAESGMINPGNGSTTGNITNPNKGSSTESGKNDRPSTGIQLTGKDKQTSTPSGSVNPDDYKPNELTTSDAGEFINIANSIIAAIRMFGTVVAVVALMALGVKYMLGSTQDKASYKESMIPYLVGAVMVFAIPNIIGIIFDLVTQIKF